MVRTAPQVPRTGVTMKKRDDVGRGRGNWRRRNGRYERFSGRWPGGGRHGAALGRLLRLYLEPPIAVRLLLAQHVVRVHRASRPAYSKCCGGWSALQRSVGPQSFRWSHDPAGRCCAWSRAWPPAGCPTASSSARLGSASRAANALNGPLGNTSLPTRIQNCNRASPRGERQPALPEVILKRAPVRRDSEPGPMELPKKVLP